MSSVNPSTEGPSTPTYETPSVKAPSTVAEAPSDQSSAVSSFGPARSVGASEPSVYPRCAESVTGVARVTTLSYDTTNRVTTITDPQSQTTAIAYDTSGRLTSVTAAGRTQSFGAEMLATSQEAFGLEDPASGRSDDVVGVAIPAAMAFLGLAFMGCALVIAGLPPLSGFLAKFSLLSAALQFSASAPQEFPVDAWLLLGAVLASSLAAIIALGRAGMHMFWNQEDTVVPRLRVSEAAPVAILLAACIALAVWAGPVQRMLDDTASSLDQSATYIDAVLTQASAHRGSP